MFPRMRRFRQQLPAEECDKILSLGTSGVLALHGDGGYPYAVPISYVYEDGRIYFHSAPSGHKIEAIKRDPKASFCVIGQDQVVPGEYTTYFKSVIAFGAIRILEDQGEKMAAIEKLALKYAPNDSAENRADAIMREWKNLCVLEMTVSHITGKEAVELTRRRGNDNIE